LKKLLAPALIITAFCLASSAYGQAGRSDESFVDSMKESSKFLLPSANMPTSLNSMSLELPSKAKKKKDVSLKLGVRIIGKSTADEYMTSQNSGGWFDLTSNMNFTNYLSADVTTGVFLFNGNSTNYYNDEGKAPTAWYIDLAQVNFKPSPALTFSAGVVPTRLVTGTAYLPGGLPGAEEKLNFQTLGVDVTLTAAQVAPPADAQKVRTESAQGASMTIENLDLKAGDITVNSDADFSLNGAYYQINGLNATTAKANVNYGNTVVGSGDAARFASDFAGYEVGSKGQVRFSKWLSYMVSGSRMVNVKAPAGSNSGYSFSTGPTITIGNFEIKPTYTLFYVESDVLPGSYGDVYVSGMNRQGQKASLKLKLVDEDVTVGGTYVRTNEIKDTPYQSDRTIYLLSLETSYDFM
jgi:hypothetical protein